MARADEGPGEAQVRRRAGCARAHGSGAHAPAASRTISEPLLRDAATVAAASFTPEQVAAATAQLEAARDKLAQSMGPLLEVQAQREEVRAAGPSGAAPALTRCAQKLRRDHTLVHGLRRLFVSFFADPDRLRADLRELKGRVEAHR